VRQFKQEKLSSALSTRTVQYCLQVLRMALNEACKSDIIPRNVAMLVEYPRVEHDEIRPYTPDEAQRFLQASQGHRHEALFSVALALGLRKGEAIGLQWPAIDLERGTLRVCQALQRLKLPGEKKGKLVTTEPKRRSRRTINLPQVCLSVLHSHRCRQEEERKCAGTAWRDTGYVFTSRIGTPLDPRNVNDEFREIVDRAGLPRIRFHDLRHTAATLLLVQGVHPRVVMDLLGHSQIAITMNTYSHVVPALRREAADKMDAILNPVAQFVAQLPDAPTPN
jgi:integrase